MATIKPFKGYRPPADKAAIVCCPPYDTMNSAEAREMAAANRDSFLRVIKPQIDLPPDTDEYADSVYQQGLDNLNELKERGVLVQDQARCLYVYRLTSRDNQQTGLMCATAVDDYDSGLIKKHEETRTAKEVDRTRMINTQNGNAGPVFLACRDQGGFSDLLNKITAAEPVCSFTGQLDVEHSFWVVEDKTVINTLTGLFNGINELYVADGHHRAFSASKVRGMRKAQQEDPQAGWNFFLTIIFPDTHLKILDYNRVIKTTNGYTTEELLERISELFDIQQVTNGRPTRKRDFGMFIDGTWYMLTARPGTFPVNDPVNSLDVAILHNNLIGPILGIKDLKQDDHIEFVGGSRGISELERRVAKDCRIAFALHPTTIDQLLSVADAGKIMPPKSTWFFPKPYSGMVFYPFDQG